MAGEIKSKFSEFYALLKQMPGVEKEDLVYRYSDGKTESLNEFYNMNKNRFNLLLNDMKTLVNATKAKVDQQDVDKVKKLRSSVLLLLQKLGVDTSNWDAVNSILMSKKIAGKLLYDMSENELNLLIKKLKAMEHSGKTLTKAEPKKEQNNNDITELFVQMYKNNKGINIIN